MSSGYSRRGFLESLVAAGLGAAVLPASRMWANSGKSLIQYVDVTKKAGIDFVHYTGAFGKKLLPETMASGCAFIDFDNDGNPDILLINAMDLPGHKRRRATMKLYRNDGNGSFTDVTVQAGLDIEMYGMGVAVGDYNNDGWDDLYITGVGESRLLRNDHGRFHDVTAEAGVGNTGFGSSAAWVDYDRDGKLDLLVANYVDWSEKGDLYCSLDGYNKSYCTPESYKGASCRLFHNLGDGRFEDVTKRAGLYDPTSKSLGVTISISTRTTGPTLPSPTIPSPINSTATTTMARSRSAASRPALPWTRAASPAAPWASIQAITTIPDIRVWRSETFPIR